MKRACRSLLPCAVAGVALVGLGGCAEYLYLVGQSSQAEQCRRLPPGDERQRCEAQAGSMSYERYRSEAAAVRGRDAK